MAAGSSLLLTGLNATALPVPRRLPVSRSLTEKLDAALQADKPLVVMVSLEGCVFCRAVRESHLIPMHEREGLAVVQVDMRSQRLTRDLTYRMQLRVETPRCAPNAP